MAKKLGFAPAQVQDALFGKMGNTGAAFCPMLLVAALEEAKPGDTILVASYGNGADILLSQSHGEHPQNQRPSRHQAQPCPQDDHPGLRDLPGLPAQPAGRFLLSARPAFRLCHSCAIATPFSVSMAANASPAAPFSTLRSASAAAVRRRTAWSRSAYPTAGQKSSPITLDNLAQIPAYDLPMVDSILDFEGGGRGCFPDDGSRSARGEDRAGG